MVLIKETRGEMKVEDCQPVEKQLRSWMVAMPKGKRLLDEPSRHLICRVFLR